MSTFKNVLSSINNGYFNFDDLKKHHITYGLDKLSPEEVKAAKAHFKERAELMSTIKSGEALPTVKQVKAFEIESADIIAGYSLTTFDYATPQPFINNLRIMAKEKGLNSDLLNFIVYGYDDDQHRYGAIVPTTADTAQILKALDCYYIQNEATA